MAGHQARFPTLTAGYESYYLRAVDPQAPRSLWLRHTVLRSPGARPRGSIWLTLFDAAAEAPVTRKWTFAEPEPEPWITVGPSRFGPDGVRGAHEDAAWDIAFSGSEAPLAHLPASWMYRAPLPRTKPVSPLPAAAFAGRARVGDAEVTVDGWTGMVGHNWGTEHAERWIWLHGTAFDGAPEAWLDLVLGRVRLAGATTPWVANGALFAGGRRHRLGGLLRRGTRVAEDPLRLDLHVAGSGLRLEATARSPRAQTAVWRYADPDGHEHHVANCSVASLDLVLRPADGGPLHLTTPHGAAYELGMRETSHGLPVQPFPDP